MPIPRPKYPVRPSDPDAPEPNASAGSQPFRDPASLRSEQPGFVLLGDVPSEYQPAPVPEDDVRGKFFRGFLAGGVLSALVIAALFFVYGSHINDAVAKLTGTIAAKPVPQSVQAPATQSGLPATAPSPAPTAATQPLTAPAEPQNATSTTPAETTATGATATDTTPPPATRPESEQLPLGEDLGAVPAAAQSNLRPTRKPTEPISSPSKSPVSQNRAPATIGAPDNTGEQDLAIAQRYLRTGGQSADSAAAALLWSAVKQGNITAEVTLAELYAHGAGVTRSCEQARVLLYAAAAKGSDEADRQLAQIARGGCR